jgi:flagellar protein FliJ
VSRRYRFRLAAVLRVRQAEEEQAAEALRRANTRVRELLAVRDEEAARYRSLAVASGPMTATELRQERAVAALVADTVAAADQAAMTAAANAALAQVAWSEAARRVTVLERLDERRRAEHADDERRAEITEVDDLVTARHGVPA